MDGTEVTAETTVLLADIGDITYYPPASQSANANYTSFTFKVTDDGSDGTGDKTSAAATITIALVNTTQADATGAPTVAATDSMATAYNEDVGLTASITGITEPNGIPAAGRNWQWQQSATMASAYTDIAGATATTFTPLQAHVGQFIRACLSFTDVLGNSEGPLCSAPAAGDAIANVNDAPVATAKTVSVDINASSTDPYTFSAADFEFTDEDVPADMLVSIAISALGTASTGTLAVDSTEVTAETTVMSADIGDITYYPPSGQSTTANYTSFTFKVTDDGSDGTGNTQSAAATITIDLVNTTQTAATGAPTVAATDSTATAHNEEVELTASATGVTEPNGIDTDTLMWQWQSAGAPASGDPDASAYTAIAGATAATFTPMQAHVGQYIRACLSFTDSLGGSEGPLCSTGTIIANVNDAPMAADIPDHRPLITSSSDGLSITAEPFLAAFGDADGDSLGAVIIKTLPDEAHGTLSIGTRMVDVDDSLLVANGAFTGGPLVFTPANDGVTSASFQFVLRDSSGEAASQDSDPATITLTFGGRDIYAEDVTMVSAILNMTAATNATDAIGGALSDAAPGLFGASFGASLGGASLGDLHRTLRRAPAAANAGNSDLPAALATADQRAWYLGTDDGWQHQAAANADDRSAEQIAGRMRALADGGLAMQYAPDASWRDLRFWARYQSMDISGNEGEDLEYEGSGTGAYLGTDRIIGMGVRSGFAIGVDNADIRLDLDGDGALDDASRSTFSLYPYLRINWARNGEMRLMIGFGSGSIDITSTANGDQTASADVGWGMLAASISKWHDMPGRMSARIDGSLQYDTSEIQEARFGGDGARIQASESSNSELALNAELQYSGGALQPFASLATRKWFGDLDQSPALDMALGTRLHIGPFAMRLAATRQINDTTHIRDTLSLDIAATPASLGLTAHLGSNWDTITGRPQWNTTIGWQRPRHSISLTASPTDYRLRARLRW